MIADYRAADGSGNAIAALEHYAHYYPFGMMQPGRNGNRYRFGFNGMEKDDEVKGTGNSYDYGARYYDPQLGRFLSIDPLAENYNFQSPYVYAINNPIRYTDYLGMGPNDEVDNTRTITSYTYTYVDDGTHQVTESQTTCNTTYSEDKSEKTVTVSNVTTTTTLKVVKGENGDADYDISAGQTMSANSTTYTKETDAYGYNYWESQGTEQTLAPIVLNSDISKSQLDQNNPYLAGYVNGLTSFITDHGADATLYNTPMKLDEVVGAIGAAGTVANMLRWKGGKNIAAIGMGHYIGSKLRASDVGNIKGRSHLLEVYEKYKEHK